MVYYIGLFSFSNTTSENIPQFQIISNSLDADHSSLDKKLIPVAIPSEAVISIKSQNFIKDDNKKKKFIFSEEHTFNVIKNNAPEIKTIFKVTQLSTTTKPTTITIPTTILLPNIEITKALPKKLIPNNSEEKIYNSEKKKYNSEEKIYNSALTAFSPSSKEVTTFEVKSNCDQYHKLGYTESGIYNLSLPGIENFPVYCLMNDDYAWTVLQRRSGPKVHFWNSSFEEYMNGFGDLKNDHWLGLEKVYSHFNQKNYKLVLRIVLIGDLCPSNIKKCSGFGEDGFWWGDWEFSIAGKSDFYRLKHLQFIKGNLSNENGVDYFKQFNDGQLFTTVDIDNDANLNRNSANYRQKGGWWHKDHTFISLNGAYSINNKSYGQSWYYNGKIKSYNIKPKYSLMLFRIKE